MTEFGPALLQATPSAVVVMDDEGRVTMLNAAAERLFGQAAGEITGRFYPEVFGPSLANRIERLFIRALRGGDPNAVHVIEATLRDGRRTRLRANAGPLRDIAGALIGVFFVADGLPAVTQAPEDRVDREGQIRHALQRYVGSTIAEQIVEHPSFVGVGGVRQTVSVLHADARGYTTIAEALEPEEISRLLLQYHGAAVAALAGEHATLDRYIGDAILALWNAPTPQPDHARMAIRGALAMVRATRAVGLDLEYGIGLHTGDAVVGNLGSAHYQHYTAIGDTVNLAARLQSAAAGGSVLCSAATLAAAGEGVRARPLGELTVKGRRRPVEAYEVEGIAP